MSEPELRVPETVGHWHGLSPLHAIDGLPMVDSPRLFRSGAPLP